MADAGLFESVRGSTVTVRRKGVSALIEFALTLNIELGLLVEDDEAAQRVQQHLESLIDSGVLQET
jgi:isocitrate/isopropylmalate dehydrogenase